MFSLHVAWILLESTMDSESHMSNLGVPDLSGSWEMATQFWFLLFYIGDFFPLLSVYAACSSSTRYNKYTYSLYNLSQIAFII